MKKVVLTTLAIVIAVIGAVMVAGCITPTTPNSENVTQNSGNASQNSPFGEWVLDSNNDITLKLDEKYIVGTSGLNSYSAEATVSNGKISFDPATMITTLMAGDEVTMKAERDYLNTLHKVTGYKFVGEKLVLTDKDGKELLTFSAVKRVLPNSSWASNDGIIIRFTEDGKLSGNAPVNLYNGNYTATDDGKLTLSSIVTTKMSGEPEKMQKEKEFLGNLEKVTGYEINGDTLNLKDAGGNTLASFKYAEMTIF